MSTPPAETAPLVAEVGVPVAAPHKKDVFDQALQDAEVNAAKRNEVIVSTLESMNITVHVIESSSEDILDDLEEIIKRACVVSSFNDPSNPSITNEQVCLYRDHQGRLVNFLIADFAVGAKGSFYGLKDSFSGVQAMICLVLLSRSLPCAFLDEIIDIKQRHLTLMITLVFLEEISLSWMNSAMYLRHMPSVSAYTLTSNVGTDALRKILTFLLVCAGAAPPQIKFYATISGITFTCLILLANLGSRAWFFMKYRPIQYNGPRPNLVAYMAAVAAGLIIPYMGHREMKAGGKRSLEVVLSTAFWVGLVFLVSGFESVPDILVNGSKQCPQGAVNITIGIWWVATLLSGMYLSLKIMAYEPKPEDEVNDVFLIKADESPVGYKVPGLSDFIFDPITMDQGSQHISLSAEILFGVIMGIGLSFCIIFEGAKLASVGL